MSQSPIKPPMPSAGGRYFREADGTLTRAAKDGRHPKESKAGTRGQTVEVPSMKNKESRDG